MLDTTTRPQQTEVQPEIQASDPNKGWAIALGLAAVIAVSVGAIWIAAISGGTPDTAPDQVSGFQYNTEATAGHVASPGVTTQYLGYSGELFPETEPAPSQAPDELSARTDRFLGFNDGVASVPPDAVRREQSSIRNEGMQAETAVPLGADAATARTDEFLSRNDGPGETPKVNMNQNRTVGPR